MVAELVGWWGGMNGDENRISRGPRRECIAQNAVTMDAENSSVARSQLLTVALSVSIQVGESCLMGQGQLKSCTRVLAELSL